MSWEEHPLPKVRYLSLVDSNGKLVGKYTNPIDLVGNGL